jgi:murein DD-endopeptidase MepM/ murein hydrolase activator NlpD
VQDTAAPAPKTSEQVASAPASYQTVTVSAERDGVGHRIVASNQGSVSVSVMVALKNRENVHSDASWPVFEVVPPRSTVTVGKIRPGSEPAQYSFRVAYRTVFGDFRAQPSPDVLYRLPFLDGKTFRISQAPGGKIVTHTAPGSAYAVDYPMPVGTAIVAAREGVVIKADGSHSEGGQTPDMLSKANAIRIQHADGTLATYGHLVANGIFVSPGQRVSAGTPIGLSGNTGYSSSPHLHFAVSRVTRSADALNTVSIPFKFYVGNPATVFIPQQGMVVKADYRRPMDVPQAIGVQR